MWTVPLRAYLVVGSMRASSGRACHCLTWSSVVARSCRCQCIAPCPLPLAPDSRLHGSGTVLPAVAGSLRPGCLGMDSMHMDGRALPTPDRRVTWMLWALTLGSFLTTSSGATRSPFLLDMAHDLDTDLLAVANLMAAMSVTWGIASLVAGTASD